MFSCLAAFTWYCSIFCLCVDTNYLFSGKSKLSFPKCLCILMRKLTFVEMARRKVQWKFVLFNVFFSSLSFFLTEQGSSVGFWEKNTEVLAQDPALSHFHSGSRSRLPRGSGINKPDIFLNYNHLPRSPRFLEAPPLHVPRGACLVMPSASAPQRTSCAAILQAPTSNPVLQKPCIFKTGF